MASHRTALLVVPLVLFALASAPESDAEEQKQEDPLTQLIAASHHGMTRSDEGYSGAASVQASQDIASQRDAVLDALNRDLEAARYAVQRAQRQYDAADPENRLVADELEGRWNTALERLRALELRVAQHRSRNPQPPAATIDEFSELADDLETVWNDPNSDARLKKRIVRALIREVVVDIDNAAGEVVLVIHWQGGAHTELRVARRKRGSAMRTAPDIIASIRVLARVSTDRMIAGFLNRNGLRIGRIKQVFGRRAKYSRSEGLVTDVL